MYIKHYLSDGNLTQNTVTDTPEIVFIHLFLFVSQIFHVQRQCLDIYTYPLTWLEPKPDQDSANEFIGEQLKSPKVYCGAPHHIFIYL